MAQYKKSNGEIIDTIEMNDAYLQRAYEKAKREGNEANVEALEEELDSRK